MNVLNPVVSLSKLSPIDISSLGPILARALDVERMCICADMHPVALATNEETGRVGSVYRSDLTSFMLLAPACLPFLPQAMEVVGLLCLGGGFKCDPPLFALPTAPPAATW